MCLLLFCKQETQIRGSDSSGQQFLLSFFLDPRKSDRFEFELTGTYGCSPMVHYRAVSVAGMLAESESTEERGTLPVARLRGMPLPKGINLGTDGDARIPRQKDVHQRN